MQQMQRVSLHVLPLLIELPTHSELQGSKRSGRKGSKKKKKHGEQFGGQDIDAMPRESRRARKKAWYVNKTAAAKALKDEIKKQKEEALDYTIYGWRFDHKQGRYFGFIHVESGEELFVTPDNLAKSEGSKTLGNGVAISCDIADGEYPGQRRRAMNIKVIGPCPTGSPS